MPQLNETTGQDFQVNADRQKFDEHLERARSLKARRAEEERTEPQQKLGSSTREDFRPNQLPDGDAIVKAGAKALGYDGDIEELPTYWPLAKIDRQRAFEAGFDELGIDRQSYEAKAWQNAKSVAGAARRDVGKAIMNPGNTAQQVPGGLIDAWNEINRFGASLDVMSGEALGYWPALQIFDEEGNLDIELQNAADPEVAERLKGDGNLAIFKNPIEAPESGTGALVRGISQFAAPFAAGNKILKGLNTFAKPGAWREIGRYALAGFAADFAAFNPEMERLSDLMDDVGLGDLTLEYLKSDDDDSELESRFKNALEGAFIGGVADVLFQGFRAGRKVRQIEPQVNERLRVLEAEEADAARVIERDIYANGDPNAPAVQTYGPPRAETAAEVAARREAAKPEPVVAGERYFDEDIFDIAAREIEGDDLFAFGDNIPNRERFLTEEIAARSTEAGNMVGFSTRAGNVGVQFMRDIEGTEIVWDWLDNAVRRDGDAAFEAREVGIRDANEIISKMFAVIEQDARTNAAPVYQFSANTSQLDKVYRRLVPKLAERMGYKAEIDNQGFRIVREDIDQGFESLRGLFDEGPVNADDRAARAGKANTIRGRLNQEFDTPLGNGGQTAAEAAQSIARELDSQRARFAADGSAGAFISTEDALQRLDALREAGEKAFGKSYNLLEQDGRITYARNAGELDPQWQRFSSSAQAVTSPGGRVTIFTETTRPQDMEGILLHEVGIHSGMQDMVGERGFEALLKRVDDLVAKGDGAAVRARNRVPASTPEADIRHETLAYLVQHAPQSPVVKELVAKLKAWTAKTFPGLTGRLGLQEADFRQLAMMALRREALISGEVVAVFGRIDEVFELGREPAKPKPMFNLSQPLLLTDRISIDQGVKVARALDIDADPADLVSQIREMKDGLLSSGMMERLFQSDEAFDPFAWRDLVEAISAGDPRPGLIDQFRALMKPLEDTAPAKESRPMFSMSEAGGRMDDRINSIVLDDIKSGRRGLDAEESEALLTAAERWASAVRAQQPQRARALEDLIEQVKTRNDPDDMADLVAIMDGAKANVPEPPSLMKFLRQQGGLKEDAGELAARDLQRVNAVNNKSGIDLDEATRRAWEAGYIGKPSELELGPTAEGRPVIDDLLDAIDRELAGDMVYSINDFDWVMEAAARRDMRAELENLGIDPNASRKQIMSEFERIAAIQEGTPITLRDIRDMERIEAQSGARPGIGLPDRDLLGGQDIRINFNAINSSDDIRSVMGQLADAFSEEVAGARGPTRGNADVIKSARQKRAWDALNERRADTPLSDSEVASAQALYVASAENVKQALDVAARKGSDTAHYAARRAITMHRAIQAEIAGAKADASRALRAWSISQSATAQARRELNSVLESYGGKLDPEEMARLRTMLDVEPEAADKAIRTMARKTSDVAGEVLRFAWLSGPHTHIMNMAGNTLTLLYDIGLRAGSGVKGVVTRDPALRRELSLAAAEYSGLMAGVRAQFSAFAKKADYGRMGQRLNEARQSLSQGNVKDALKSTAAAVAYDNPVSATFRGRFDDRGVSGRKFDGGGAGPSRAISAEAFGMQQGSAGARVVDGLGALVSAPVDFLGFQDDFFKGINEMATRYRRAQEIVMEELDNGLPRSDAQRRFAELVENPPEEVLAEARQAAQRRTFTEPVGEGTRSILKLRNFANKTGFPLGHILLPFVVTPSNILKFAFQNGPTGILFREIRDELNAGGTRRALAQSRIAAGTGLMMIGMDMVANGVMTGRAPTDPGERELWQRDGRQEYALKIGDKWVSYRRLEPVSTMMAIGADLQTIYLNSELEDDADRDWAEIIGPVLGAFVQVISSKTYLTSASEFVKFSEDPERYGPNYIERLAASITAPAGLSQIEEINDPIIREASKIEERWMSRMPGFSETLPPAYDLWGRQRHVSSELGHWYDALSPFTVRTEDPEPIDNELRRIGFYPRRPPKQITVRTPSGVSVAVNLRNRPEIWSRYVQLAGNETKPFNGLGLKDYLNAVIEGRHPDAADYQLLPDSATEPISKEKFIDRRIQQARRVARIELEREFRADLQAMAQASLEAQRRAEARASELTAP